MVDNDITSAREYPGLKALLVPCYLYLLEMEVLSFTIVVLLLLG